MANSRDSTAATPGAPRGPMQTCRTIQRGTEQYTDEQRQSLLWWTEDIDLAEAPHGGGHLTPSSMGFPEPCTSNPSFMRVVVVVTPGTMPAAAAAAADAVVITPVA